MSSVLKDEFWITINITTNEYPSPHFASKCLGIQHDTMSRKILHVHSDRQTALPDQNCWKHSTLIGTDQKTCTKAFLGSFRTQKYCLLSRPGWFIIYDFWSSPDGRQTDSDAYEPTVQVAQVGLKIIYRGFGVWWGPRRYQGLWLYAVLATESPRFLQIYTHTLFWEA